MSDCSKIRCPHAHRCEYLQRFPDAESRLAFANVLCNFESEGCARRQFYDRGDDPGGSMMPSGIDAAGVFAQLSDVA